MGRKAGDILWEGVAKFKGRMPIAPFENNLAYRIYDQSGIQLAQGPFPVSADEPGSTAEFDHAVDLSIG